MNPVSLYRDPLAGLRSQIALKRGRLAHREKGLSSLVRAMLPERVRQPLVALSERVLDEPDSLEGLASVDAALDEILALHDDVAALVPKLRECPDEVPDPPKPQVSPPWVIEELYQLGFRSMLTRQISMISPDAYLVRWDDTTYLSRIRLAYVPLVVTSRIDIVYPTRFRSTARTSVPRTVPALQVRPDRPLFDGIGRAFGLVHDVRIGHPEFDDAFVVVGEPATTSLLSPRVTRALLEIEHLQPVLIVRRGLVELTWGAAYKADADALVPDQAIAIVLDIRAAIERA